MRVFMLNPALSGGAYSHYLCTALVDAGVTVELFTGPHFERTVGAAHDAPYPVHLAFYRRTQFRSYARGAMRPLWRGLRLGGHVWSMRRFARESRRADLVHVQFLAVPRLDIRWLRRIAQDVPMVYTVHNAYPHDVGRSDAVRRLYGEIYRLADVLIVHTEHTRRVLEEEFGIAGTAIVRVPFGAYPVVAPAALVRHTGPLRVLFFGEIRRNKGLGELLEAVAQLEARGIACQLTVAGACTDFRPYRAQIERLSLTDRVETRIEYIPEPEVRDYFAAADVIALPYTTIDQSAVAHLALSFGRPLVASSIGGLADLLRASEGGLPVPPADTTALADALERLAREPALRTRLGANGARYAEGMLSWKASARDTIGAYRMALRRRR